MTKISLDNSHRIRLISDGQSDIVEVQESRRFNGNFNRRTGSRAETPCCAFSSDGKLLAWTIGNGYVKVINFAQLTSSNTNDGTQQSAPEGVRLPIDCAKKVLTMKFAPIVYDTNDNAKYILATGLECGRIKLWNPFTGAMILNLMDHASGVKGLSFASSGEPLLISCSLDRTLKVWDLADDGNMTLTIEGHPLAVLDCAYSPVDTSMICSVGKSRWVVLWRLKHKRSYSKHIQLRGHNNDVVSCTWSPDGALVATASHDTIVILWDPYNGQQIMILGHANPLPEPIFAGGANGAWVSCACFSPDGSKLATLCEDERLRIWPLWTNESPTQSQILSKPGSVCVFSPTGSAVALGNCDGSVSVMDAPVSVMPLRHLCRMAARRTFDSNQMKKYLTLPASIKRYLSYTQYNCNF